MGCAGGVTGAVLQLLNHSPRPEADTRVQDTRIATKPNVHQVLNVHQVSTKYALSTRRAKYTKYTQNCPSAVHYVTSAHPCPPCLYTKSTRQVHINPSVHACVHQICVNYTCIQWDHYDFELYKINMFIPSLSCPGKCRYTVSFKAKTSLCFSIVYKVWTQLVLDIKLGV